MLSGPVAGDAPQGVVDRLAFTAECPGAVVSRARDVMVCVLDGARAPWPGLETWQTILPGWFTESCAPERSPEQARRELAAWRRLTSAERAAWEPAWSLSGWLHWFDPDGDSRGWAWWDAGTAEEVGWIDVVAEDVPFASGALLWLVTAAGGRLTDAQ